jgi:hypothetical protein
MFDLIVPNSDWDWHSTGILDSLDAGIVNTWPLRFPIKTTLCFTSPARQDDFPVLFTTARALFPEQLGANLKMLSFLRWIQRWREERKLVNETEAREEHRHVETHGERQSTGETDSRIQHQVHEARCVHPEKPDDRQAQTLLILCELQRTMEPMVAASFYNYHFCPLISRLPDELFLCIFDFLCDDMISLLCLRIVSRRCFRLLDSCPRFFGSVFLIRGMQFSFDHLSRIQFRRLLQRDGRCDDCRSWNDTHGPQPFDDCKFQQRFRAHYSHASYERVFRKLHCDACDSLHDVCQFSASYQQSFSHQVDRRCLGQQGSVKLCEHIQISWARIKAHIDDWRQQQCGRGDWQACLDSFKIECHDASHDTCCTTSGASTWPRAHLGISARKADTVVLNLEWIPHIRIDPLSLTANGRIRASELKESFQRLRNLGPIDTLCPGTHLHDLPEMWCFSLYPHYGIFVGYTMGKDDSIRASLVPFPLLSLRCLWLIRTGFHGLGLCGKKIQIRPHSPRGGGSVISPECLMVSYEKDIMICKTEALTDPEVKIVPTDYWLHAMDPQTYPHPQASHIRPQCRDVNCINYYQRSRDFYCI